MTIRGVLWRVFLIVALASCGENGAGTVSDVTIDKVWWPHQDTRSPDVKTSNDAAESDAPETTACVDNDGDGYGVDCPKGPDCNDSIKTCHVDCETDADQNGVPDCEEAVCSDEEIYYNGIDDDCDPVTSDADKDGDKFNAYAMGGSDCDDDNQSVNPGAQEVCGDWLDNNCDGFPISGSNQPECPQGQMCNLQTGQCEDDPDCNGCPMGQVCQGGKCDVDETCYGGCPEKQKCTPESGLCVVVGCLEEPCPDDGKSWACNPYTGYCYITSCEESCPKGKVCNPETGLCDVDQDCGGACLMNETCDQNTGTCGPTPSCPADFCWGWPEGMWRVEGPDSLYYIDQYEWPNHLGQMPSANIDNLTKVQDMCFSIGKRPCTVEELSAACDGVVGTDGSELPYAQTLSGYDPLLCNTEGAGVEDSGSHPGCANQAFDVWDLVGNLAEWTAQGTLFGGSFDDGVLATCSFTTPPGSIPIEEVGFRCCVSPDDDLDNDGYTAAQECDDGAPGIHPGAKEKCNDVDDDCNGLVDDAEDEDGDGFTICQEGAECDKKKLSNPDAEDMVGDGQDQNCDGVDGVDADDDGQASTESGGEDCNDEDDDTFFGAPDNFGDDIDQNCDEFDGVDTDGDKHAGNAPSDSPAYDCNDADATVYVGTPDTVGDQKDQNCDGVDGVDADGDGQASEASGGEDCNDSDDNTFIGSADGFGDGIDQNCDNVDGVDADGDGQASVGSGGEDCDDDDPFLLASCDGKECGDDNCGGTCGTCGCGETCLIGLCVYNACNNKECGDDGCGESCGTCSPAEKCQASGQCGWCFLSGQSGSDVLCPIWVAAADMMSPKATALQFQVSFPETKVSFEGVLCEEAFPYSCWDACFGGTGWLPSGHKVACSVDSGEVNLLIYHQNVAMPITQAYMSGEEPQGDAYVMDLGFTLAQDIPVVAPIVVSLTSAGASDATAQSLEVAQEQGILVTSAP